MEISGFHKDEMVETKDISTIFVKDDDEDEFIEVIQTNFIDEEHAEQVYVVEHYIECQRQKTIVLKDGGDLTISYRIEKWLKGE